MGVRADVAGHDQLPARVDALGLRVAFEQVARAPDRADRAVFDVERVVGRMPRSSQVTRVALVISMRFTLPAGC